MKKPVEIMTGEELWSLFFAFGSDPKHRDLLNKMIAVRREIKMSVELLQTISRDEDERARFRARRKFQMDMEHNLIVARDDGIMTVAKNLLRMDMPIEKIVEATGLTRSEVEGLRDAS